MDVHEAPAVRAAPQGGTAAASGQCERCACFIGGPESGGATGRCQAFADIPEALWSNRVSHAGPYPGDRGLRFKPWK
jgi:hypothetical protein